MLPLTPVMLPILCEALLLGVSEPHLDTLRAVVQLQPETLADLSSRNLSC